MHKHTYFKIAAMSLPYSLGTAALGAGAGAYAAGEDNRLLGALGGGAVGFGVGAGASHLNREAFLKRLKQVETASDTTSDALYSKYLDDTVDMYGEGKAALRAAHNTQLQADLAANTAQFRQGLRRAGDISMARDALGVAGATGLGAGAGAAVSHATNKTAAYLQAVS